MGNFKITYAMRLYIHIAHCRYDVKVAATAGLWGALDRGKVTEVYRPSLITTLVIPSVKEYTIVRYCTYFSLLENK